MPATTPGVEITSTNLPATVKKVRMGSAAFYAGLQDNDVITNGTLKNHRLQITFKRGTAVYAVNLPTQAQAHAQIVRQVDTSQLKKDPAWKKLSNYKIVMLIDQSASMADAIDGNGTSKWDWCSQQLSDFAAKAAASGCQSLSLITFNDKYVLRRNCDPKEVHHTFIANTPGGATDMATPLDFALKEDWQGQGTTVGTAATTAANSARSKAPLLIAVMTDGMPARFDLVQQCIIDATRRMTDPAQIKIVFFEIGNDADGAALLKLLDYGLVSDGARYDIVEANSFGRLQEIGLKQALYESFSENDTKDRTQAATNLEEELAQIRKQLIGAQAGALKR